MGFISKILDSIPEEQKSGLEPSMAAMVKGMGGAAISLEALEAVGASLGKHGITMASEGASNAAAPMSASLEALGVGRK